MGGPQTKTESRQRPESTIAADHSSLMKTNTITLIQANEEGFDPDKFNFDIKNTSNVKVFCVLRVIELVNDGHLHYVKLEFNNGDITDPKADPMIIDTISHFLEQESEDQAVSPKVINNQWRVMWNNKLWRPLNDNTAMLLECFMGISKEDIKVFADKLASNQFCQNLRGKLLSEAAQ